MNMQQLVAGKSKAQINAMADKLEQLADVAAPAKGAGVKAAAVKAPTTKAALAKAAAAKTAGSGSVAGKSTMMAGATAKSGSTKALAACCSSKGWGLGLGLGLGAFGPVLLTVGGAAIGWYAYKKFFADRDIDAPSF
jgi:hypothetical protein